MARTLEQVDVTVVGGPRDGLRLLGKIKDDSTVQLIMGQVFFPEGLDHYHFDSTAHELVYLGDD